MATSARPARTLEPGPSDADRVEHAATYYAATAHAAPERSRLKGTRECDVCVVGAGFSGLSTALHLAERGYRVIVVEAACVGWGASGRNGGQLVNGYSRDIDEIERRYGADAADALGHMAFEGAHIIRELVDRHAIDCDLRDGGLCAAFNTRQLRVLERRERLWERFGHTELELLDADGLRRHVATELYTGGLLDRWGGHVHTLNLALGEAAALESVGGVIHEQSAVTRIGRGPRPSVHTADGTVRADYVVLCGNAYLGDTVPELRDVIMPVSTQVMTTERLGADIARGLIPSGVCVEDCNYILDYYRVTADDRLLFGGGSLYGGTTPRDIVAKLRPHLARTFPALATVPIEWAWSGNFALTLTRIPHLGRLDERTYFTHGYSGHGLTTTHLAGRLIAEAVATQAERFDVFAGLTHHPFPGGRTLRVPLCVLGSWYYLLREKLGI